MFAGIAVATRDRYSQPQQQQHERDAFKRQQREFRNCDFRNCDFHDSNSKATGYFYCDILAQLIIEGRAMPLFLAQRSSLFAIKLCRNMLRFRVSNDA